MPLAQLEPVPVPIASANGRPVSFDSAADRYEWLMQHRSAWVDDDAAWMAAYATTDDYADLRAEQSHRV